MKRTFALVPVLLLGWSAFGATPDPVRLKNAREIYASYAAIMNVPENDAALHELYRINAERLPRGGAPEELSNGVVMGATELGGAFCNNALTKEKALPHGQRTLFSDVDFKRGPSQFGDYLKGLVLEHFAMAFWQRDITDPEKASLSATMDKSVKNAKDTTDETVKEMQVLCTTFATSLAFLVK